MGNRANFVVIKDGSATAFEDNWAALGCTYDFACGLTQAAEALKEYTEASVLMDWAFAEAGYLIDHDTRFAMVFGIPQGAEDFFDDEEAGDLPEEDPSVGKLRDEDYKGFLEGIAEGWKGWKIVWDDRGVDAFAEYLIQRGINGIGTAAPSHPPSTLPQVSHQA